MALSSPLRRLWCCWGVCLECHESPDSEEPGGSCFPQIISPWRKPRVQVGRCFSWTRHRVLSSRARTGPCWLFCPSDAPAGILLLSPDLVGGGSGGGREREISKTRYEKTGNFPGGLESRTVKADRQRIDASELWCWRKFLRVPCTAGDQTCKS